MKPSMPSLIIAVLLPYIVISSTLPDNIHAKIFQSLIENNTPAKEMFKMFHHINEKQYDLNSEEGIRRYKSFKLSLKEISEHNSKPNVSYKLGVTQLADISDYEYLNTNPLNTENVNLQNTPIQQNEKETFDTINWTERGIFGPTMYASNTACAATNPITYSAAMEAQYNLKYRTGASFSPQSLIDCNPNGCKGYDSLTYYSSYFNYGSYTSANYPWKGAKGTCSKKNVSPYVARNWEQNSVYFNPLTSSRAVSILKRGPYIFRSGFYLPKLYTGGIYTPSYSYDVVTCGASYYNLLNVGYGIDASSGTDYWIIRADNGNTWGEGGYIRVKRDDTKFNWGITCFYSRPVS